MARMASEQRGRHAWVDASAGVAGDMVLGALVDAGAPLAEVQSAVDAVLPGAVRLRTSQVLRAGMRATKLDVDVLVTEQPHRRWADIRQALVSADLAERVRDRSLSVFGRLAGAEARVHGLAVEDVHFHEVGAWDSVADLVGACAALEALGVETLSAGPISLGAGRARSAHGELPVPVPAVLELSRGWRVRAGADAGSGELATPTGVALVTALASRCEELPAMEVAAVGIGAGSKDFADRANVVRVVLGREEGANPTPGDAMWVLEANVDDLDPRVWPGVLADLLAAGAADAWLVPILMKKGRPAHTVCVLASAEVRDVLRDKLFRLTSSIGVRQSEVERVALDRLWVTVDVRAQPVRVKVAHRNLLIVTATPEFEDVAALAATEGLAVRHLLDEAAAAARSAGLVPGATVPGMGA